MRTRPEGLQVLAQLLYRPDAAALYSWITWELGRGVAEYLLQQASWMLQDVETLTGSTPLARVCRGNPLLKLLFS